MSDPLTPSRRVTTVRELALRLLAGEPLRRCHGIGWTIGEAAHPVDAEVLRALGNGFRLAPAGDALPGFGAALSQTLLLEPLLDDSDLMARLRPAVRAAGGIGAYARLHGVGKSTVAMVEGAHRDMTSGIALTLGMLPHITWRPDPARRRASAAQEAA